MFVSFSFEKLSMEIAMKYLARLFFTLFFTAFLAACGGSSDSPATSASGQLSPAGADGSSAPSASIASIAQQQGFNALLAAATKAELTGTLGDASSRLTVFAPTDTAFNQLATRLGFADAAAMVNALPASALKDILAYHVLPAPKTASDLASGGAKQDTLYLFEEKPATLGIDAADGVKLTDAALTTANVTTANVAAGNSVIHVIDKVLVPPGVLNIVQMAQANPVFSSLVGAVVTTGLQDALSAPGPFTVFAPIDAAFEKAPAGLTPDQLSIVLKYHVLDSQVLASQIPFGTPIRTLANQHITINHAAPPTIADTTDAPATISATDVRASNGVIHVIDKVLIPAL